MSKGWVNHTTRLALSCHGRDIHTTFRQHKRCQCKVLALNQSYTYHAYLNPRLILKHACMYFTIFIHWAFCSDGNSCARQIVESALTLPTLPRRRFHCSHSLPLPSPPATPLWPRPPPTTAAPACTPTPLPPLTSSSGSFGASTTTPQSSPVSPLGIRVKCPRTILRTSSRTSFPTRETTSHGRGQTLRSG